MLEWKDRADGKMIVAESNAAVSGSFRIHYDDVMYWPSWDKDCTQDLNALKAEAQKLHNEFQS